MVKYPPARHLPHRIGWAGMRLLWVLLRLCALLLVIIKPVQAVASLDVSPIAPQVYYSYDNPNYYVVPGAKYLGAYPQRRRWYFVPWETPHAKHPAAQLIPDYLKGLKAMIAAGSNNYDISYQTIQPDILPACVAYVRYYYAYGLPWSKLTQPFYAAGTYSVTGNGCTHSLLGYFGLPSVATTCTEQPAYYPNIPYDYNKAADRCERMIPQPEQYTIALSGLGGEVMPNATRSAYAQVTKKSDGSPKSGAQVALTLTVVPDSGSPTDPSNVGRLSLTSGLTGANGRLPFVFTAPLAGGMHTITAKCTNCTNEATGTIKVLGCPVGDLTDIPTLSALAGETPEQTQLTQDLEGGMDGYSLLSPATQTAEQCLADKINATPVSGYKVTSTVRTVAYQRHLRNVWDKFWELKKSDTSIQQRCQTLITKVEGEMGFLLTQNPKDAGCNTALGRAHCVRHGPAEANPKHTQSIAFDIPLDTVDGYKQWLRQQTPRSTVAQQANTCGLTWGDSFGDPIHFFLLQ